MGGSSGIRLEETFMEEAEAERVVTVVTEV
jgi:hypothetical protein